MIHRRYLAAALAVLLLPAGCSLFDHDVVYQTSTVTALLEGVYDGDVTVGRLRRKGNLGLGTFNGLDGEMVMVDGTVYRVRGDGKAFVIDDRTRMPFYTVTHFKADRTGELAGAKDLKGLYAFIDGLCASANVPYAVRITGRFRYVKARSVPRQPKPYPKLAKVIESQPTFEWRDVAGTMVGFRLPAYVEGVNVPGYHLHFLSADGASGGHVLACQALRVQVGVDECSSLRVDLPATENFRRAELPGRAPGRVSRLQK
ncbi:MAG: acetolactate decarboxylase [Planctomycetota bacterium]|jgi:acetolactate decarboxylase